MAANDYSQVPLPGFVPDEDGLEQIREIAIEMAMNFTFHEVAIADPFKAERYVEDAGRRLLKIVGHPKGWFTFERREDPE